MQRSMTPNTPTPGVTAPGSTFGSGLGMRSGFASGLMGGLIGAGIGGLLFGHGFFGGGGLGFGGFLGFLLQIGLIVLAGSLLVRWLPPPAVAGVCRRPQHLCPGRRSRPASNGRLGWARRATGDPDRRTGL